MSNVLIIAEAGVNHNGSVELAFKLVDAAHQAGANIVKFQTFKAKNLVTATAKQADYQVTNTKKAESQLSMLSRLELSYQAHHDLIAYCNKLGIEFLSTAFDSDSLEFLANDLGLKTLKIPSGEITNAPLILEHARTKCNIIVSTGMATLAEVESALGVIAFGYMDTAAVKPSISAFQEAYYSNEGQRLLKEKVSLLHCTTEYPAPFVDINMKAMDTLGHAFQLPVGYSDHSEGIVVPIVAVARGATIIEKHFTLDKEMEGPDHKASLNPIELKEMITSIRIAELSIGSSLKGPMPSEIKNRGIARKSLVVINDIFTGEMLTEKNLGIKRPGTGLSPYQYWELLGKKASKDYKEGDLFIE